MPVRPLAERLRQLTGLDLPDLAGASIAGEIPLTAAVLNRLIARQLSLRGGLLAGVHIELQQGQRLLATLTLGQSRFVPSLRVFADIEGQARFPQEPVLRLRWSLPGFGRLALLGGPVLSFLQALPPAFHVHRDCVDVDLGALLHERGLGELVHLITRFEIVTQHEAILLRYAAAIPITASEFSGSH